MNKYILPFSLFEASGSDSQSVKFSFNFPEGKYKKEDIPSDKLESLKKDLFPIVNQLKKPTKANLKTTINLIASTSNKALSSNLKKELEVAGFKSAGNGNDALATARLKTLEEIVEDTLSKNLDTPKDVFKKSVNITKIPKPNAGPGTSFQFISFDLQQSGDPFPEDKKMGCNTDKVFNGVKGDKNNNFLGYSEDLWLPFDAGQTINIELNTYAKPDCIYIKYGDKEFLTGFVGDKGEKGVIFDGSEYQEKLTQLNTNGDLAKAIESVMKSAGSSKTLKDLDPKFTEIKSKTFGGSEKVVRVKERDETNSKFSIKKKFGMDKLIIRVFSPLDKTQFKIKTSCG